MTKPSPISKPQRMLQLVELRRAARADWVSKAVLLQMNLRSRGGRRS